MIEFRNVEKVYPNGTVALDGISFRVNDGEFVFIVGASGAGKTTLTKLLLLEEQPTKGKILVDNFDLGRLRKGKRPYYRRTIGFVFQDFRLLPTMTVYDNVAFAMRAIGAGGSKIRQRVPNILKLIGMQDRAGAYPETLSGGEAQRVALARALVNNPKYIIADEPTGNIDPKRSHEILELLAKINSLGRTVIVITHEKGLVDELRKRVITVREGKIVSDLIGGYESGQEP